MEWWWGVGIKLVQIVYFHKALPGQDEHGSCVCIVPVELHFGSVLGFSMQIYGASVLVPPRPGEPPK